MERIDNFTPLNSCDWQIHVYGQTGDAVREFSTLRGLPLETWSWNEVARDAGLVENALYFVRPDGHIGFMRRTQDIGALKDYLLRFGLVEQIDPNFMVF